MCMNTKTEAQRRENQRIDQLSDWSENCWFKVVVAAKQNPQVNINKGLNARKSGEILLWFSLKCTLVPFSEATLFVQTRQYFYEYWYHYIIGKESDFTERLVTCCISNKAKHNFINKVSTEI